MLLYVFARFVVSNGKATRNGTLEIFVETTDRVLPSLACNSGLRVPQDSSMAVTPDVLALSDPDTPPSDLLFFLAQPPQYGTLLRGGVPLAAGGNFTQWDLQELEVTYRHGGGPSHIDRFAFTASDTTNRSFLLEGRVQTEPVIFTIQVGHTYLHTHLCPGMSIGIQVYSRSAQQLIQ